jgi:hypothetical protein
MSKVELRNTIIFKAIIQCHYLKDGLNLCGSGFQPRLSD